MCKAYIIMDELFCELLDNMKILQTKHYNEWLESIKQFEIRFQKGKDMRNNNSKLKNNKINNV